MRPAASLQLKDPAGDDEAYVFVRAFPGAVALSVAGKAGGDCEVYLSPKDAGTLRDALAQAVAIAASSR